MAQRSYLREIVRRAPAGVPALTPPRAPFRRWGTVTTMPAWEPEPSADSGPVRADATGRDRNASRLRAVNTSDGSVGGSPRTGDSPIDEPHPATQPVRSTAAAEDVAPATAPPSSPAPALTPSVDSVRAQAHAAPGDRGAHGLLSVPTAQGRINASRVTGDSPIEAPPRPRIATRM